MIVWGDHMRRIASGSRMQVWSSGTSPSPAHSRSIRIHSASSETLELTPTAPAAFSKLMRRMGLASPPTSTWGVATLPSGAGEDAAVTVRSIPRGSRMRVCTSSRQLMPETRAASCPATMYITLLYA